MVFRRIILAVLALCLLFGAACAELAPGTQVPEITVTTTDGTRLALSDVLKEKELVVLNIFATWCPPCAAEFPEMEAVYREYGDRMEIIAVSGDPDDTMEMVAAYREEKQLTFPMGLPDPGALDFFRLEGYPTTLLIDRYGNLGMFRLGAFSSGAEFESAVKAFLGDGYDGKPRISRSVLVVDQNVNPVPGATVRFTREGEEPILTGETDSEGVAVAMTAEADYTVEAASLPEGYTAREGAGQTMTAGMEWVVVFVTKAD